MLEQLLVSSTSKTELSICFVKRRGASVVQTAPLLAWDSGVLRSYTGWRNSVSMHVNFGVVSAVKSLMCANLQSQKSKCFKCPVNNLVCYSWAQLLNS